MMTDGMEWHEMRSTPMGIGLVQLNHDKLLCIYYRAASY